MPGYHAPKPPTEKQLAAIEQLVIDPVAGKVYDSEGKELGGPWGGAEGYWKVNILYRHFNRSHLIWWKYHGSWPVIQDYSLMAVDSERVITLTLDPRFMKLAGSIHRQHPPKAPYLNVLHEPVLALDPGETTGVAEFDGDNTIRVYQKVTKDIGQSYDWLRDLLINGDTALPQEMWRHRFKHLRYEDYRVYEWKSRDHAWSPVHTIRWIGAIQVAAHVTQMPNSCIMAQAAKGWWTDSKLDLYGLNPKGLKHGRDALRHLLYYLLFPTKA